MSSENVARLLHQGEITQTDPGASGTIVVRKNPCLVNLTSAAAETRTLARPTRQDVTCTLHHYSDGGDITLTVTGGYNENGDTSFTFSDPGQFATFYSLYDGTNYFWRMISNHAVAQILSSASTAFISRVTTTDGVASGTARVVGGLAYSNTAASTAVVGSTATEQLFDTSYTIPANTLKAGTVVKVRVQGIATTTSSTDTIAYKLYIGGSGGTALVSVGATNATDNDTFLIEDQVVCRTAGTTGTMVAVGTYKVSSAEGTMTVKDDFLASTTVNTQANQAIVVTGTWSVANACNSCRVDILTVEIY